MKVAIPNDIYNKEGEMVKIEFNDRSGEHIIDSIWDPRDEQTSENRVQFRKWSYRMVEQLGYAVLK